MDISAYVGSDNYVGGQLAGSFILEKLSGGETNIVFFEGVVDQETAQQRKAGFFNILNGQNITLVAEFVADWNKEKAFEAMNIYLAKGEDFNAIFASNDQMALGVIESLERNGINPEDKIIVGFDAIPEAIEAINTGKLNATIRQKPGEMGRIAMQLAIDLINGKRVSRNHPIKVEIIK